MNNNLRAMMLWHRKRIRQQRPREQPPRWQLQPARGSQTVPLQLASERQLASGWQLAKMMAMRSPATPMVAATHLQPQRTNCL